MLKEVTSIDRSDSAITNNSDVSFSAVIGIVDRLDSIGSSVNVISTECLGVIATIISTTINGLNESMSSGL